MEEGTVTGSSRAASRDRPETQFQLQLQLQLSLSIKRTSGPAGEESTMHDPRTGNLLTNQAPGSSESHCRAGVEKSPPTNALPVLAGAGGASRMTASFFTQ